VSRCGRCEDESVDSLLPDQRPRTLIAGNAWRYLLAALPCRVRDRYEPDTSSARERGNVPELGNLPQPTRPTRNVSLTQGASHDAASRQCLPLASVVRGAGGWRSCESTFLAMQKVEGSSPLIRSRKAPRGGAFPLRESGAR